MHVLCWEEIQETLITPFQMPLELNLPSTQTLMNKNVSLPLRDSKPDFVKVKPSIPQSEIRTLYLNYSWIFIFFTFLGLLGI